MGKCRGLRTARKMHNHRRAQKWPDKQYKRAHLGTALKANPFSGASQAKGIVLETVGAETKQPSLAIRKCVRVRLIKNPCTVLYYAYFYIFIRSYLLSYLICIMLIFNVVR
ncbi:RS23 protein, partial [Atractosteus spatula]|nr:RS23 protein [Atractosteus spatula]